MIDNVLSMADERLRDGTPVHIRPIHAEDKKRLIEGLGRLSSRSRYHRFFGAISALTEKTLKYLTEVDQVNHIAWIAVDPTRRDEPALGVARCVRLETDPAIAEIAITVADACQNRGLGSLLIEQLATSALERGIRTFRAVILRENSVVLHALQEVGVRGRLDDGEVHVDVPVEEVRALAHAYRTG